MARMDAQIRPEVIEEVATRALPRRPWVWPGHLLIVMAAGVICTALYGLSGKTAMIPPVVIVTIITAVVVVVFGVRRWSRGRSIDKMIEAVNAAVRAAAPTRDLVKAGRWKGGWIGHPERITVTYPADIVDTDPKFIETLVGQVTNRMGILYRVRKNNSRRCYVILEVDNTEEADPIDPDCSTIESILSPIVPGLRVSSASRDDAGQLDEIKFQWPASANSRMGKRFFQKQTSDAIEQFVGRSYAVDFDLTQQRAVAAPLVPLPDVIPHPPRNDDEPMKVAFGQFRDGSRCIWDLDAPLPHLLIVGGTGGGKTVLLLAILTALPNKYRRNAFGQWVEDVDAVGAEIWPIDPKRLGLFNLDLIPGAKRAATREAAIVTYIMSVKAKMDERYAYLEKNGPHLRATLDPLVLAVDEGEEMVDLLNDWWRSGEGKKDWCERMGLEKAPTGNTHPVMTAFGSILRLGREARVHVILASQQAAASWLNTSSRSQFAVRIALRNLEQSTSLMTFGSLVATSGLENHAGRAWVSVGMGMQPEHAQIYWTPKLAPGLNAADREILHGLGITLPDDPNYAGPEADSAPVPTELPSQQEEIAPEERRPSGVHFEPSDEIDEISELADNIQTFEVAVSELEIGMQILVDVDGTSRRAEIESVDVDTEDPECMCLGYLTEDGESRLLTVPEAETVTVVLEQ